jgi:hypothetical protein
MSDVLHRAILDSLRDAPGYREKGILVAPLLEATTPLAADEALLYQVAYTIFCTMPDRLLPGSLFHVATQDAGMGVQLQWEGREPLREAPTSSTARGVLGRGPHGDLLEIAMLALERFCQARAGFVDVVAERVPTSSAFTRPAHVVRRVVAFLPGPAGASAEVAERLRQRAHGQA